MRNKYMNTAAYRRKGAGHKHVNEIIKYLAGVCARDTSLNRATQRLIKRKTDLLRRVQ